MAKMSPYLLKHLINAFRAKHHRAHYRQTDTDHNHCKQLATHHDRNKSVAVSAVVNSANTIQYIIHFTWIERDTHAQKDTHRVSKHKNST